MKYKIKIELLSDMCPSSGGTYGSVVDNDIEYDSYGIPYISAKRIKGCLRESALLMREWGIDIPVEEIFGKEGNRKGSLRLGSAKVPQHDQYHAEITEYGQTGLAHPQNVLRFFSYIRVQTALEGGVAKEGSLRVLRVLKKGLVFEAEALLAEIYFQAMIKICRCTRNMGLNRTRGMGEVKVSFEKVEQNKQLPAGFERVEEQISRADDGHKMFRLDYRLKLLEPAILKSPDRGQEKTLDYIEGNKMLGALAGRMGNYEYRELTEKRNIICSNLYIADTEERYYPAPASLKTIKDDDSGKVYDLVCGHGIDMQTKNLENSYVKITDGEIHILKVNTQIKNHHSRPADKSIGYARGQGEGDFYQLSGIMAGQTFMGYILADKGQMQTILKTMKGMRNFEMGYGSAAEYGKVDLVLDKVGADAGKKEKEDREFAVLLLAPVILYNEAGMYTQDVNALAAEISEIVGEKVVPDMEKLYLKYTMIGGWQSMWGKPKQTAWVLDKGTVILMRTEKGNKVHIPGKSYFVGERNMEGYGEIVLSTVSKQQVLQSVKDKGEKEKIEATSMADSDLVKYLREKDEEKVLKKAGRSAAQKIFSEKTYSRSESAATVNKLILTLKEQKTEEKFNQVIQSIKSKQKKKIAARIADTIDHNIENCSHIKRQEAFEVYMRAFLAEAKYQLRSTEEIKQNE